MSNSIKLCQISGQKSFTFAVDAHLLGVFRLLHHRVDPGEVRDGDVEFSGA
ncbi:MAG: hypothetical protein WD492_01295 [Alkalispirochaeta sp.]